MKKCFRKSMSMGIIVTALIFGMTFVSFAADLGSYCGQPGKPAIQLLPTVGLGVLRDSFCHTGSHVSPKPQLTIENKANATLNVLLYSTDGTKYDLKVPQGGDNTWSLNPGSYRTELIIPGFPSMAGASMTIEKNQTYHWEIRRSEL